jgi:addiction module RelE/StbE family toxin
MYTVKFTSAAAKVLKKLDKPVQNELANKAKLLEQTPLLGKPLKGKYRVLRSFHVSYKGIAYRVIYQVVSHAETVIIFLADKRENIYRRLEHMKI